ncbi:hypothetical protein J7K50_09005 [bacterium]|nr:hypothetical protein [bacterium]
MRGKRVIIELIVVAALGILLLSCTGGSPSQSPDPDSSYPLGWSPPEDVDRAGQGSGFRLVTMDERGNPRPDLLPKFEINIIEDEETTRVDISAVEFEDADWVFFFLYYDPDVYRPRGVEFTEFMGAPGEVLSLAITGYWEYVAVGMARIHFTERPGVSGSGLICTMTFDNTPFGPRKYVAKDSQDSRMGPTGGENRVSLIASFFGETAHLEWFERNIGDGDNSGEVGVPDITPIAMNYLDNLNDPATIADKPWLVIVDYDGNQEIGVPDITPIAVRFLTNLVGYQVLKSTDGTNYSPITTGVTVTREDAATGMGIEGSPATEDGRLHYTWDDPTPPEVKTYYKVVPIGSDGLATIESNPASVVPMKDYTAVRIEPPEDPDALPLIVTEVSRLFPDAAESFARPQVQFKASGILEGSTEWEDATDAVVWDIETNDTVASITKGGLVTGLNRGYAVVRVMSAFDYDIRDTYLITCSTISSIELTRDDGSTDPISITPGTPLSFIATGTFVDGVDPDAGTPEDETPPIDLDITPYVGWLEVHETDDPDVAFTFHSSGVLYTDDPLIQAGDWARVFCQFPGWVPEDPNDPDNDLPKIMFGYVATSDDIQVTFE